MTLVECFDRNPVKNILGCLRHNPERVIFVGEERHLKNPIRTFQKILNDRGLAPEIIVREVEGDNPTDILEALTDIVKNEFYCVIDVNGGKENMLMAVGMLLGSLSESQKKRVSVQDYNQFTEMDIDLDGNGQLICGDRITLTEHEIVALHGGMIYPRVEHQYEEYTAEDIEPLWRLMNENTTVWNKSVIVLSEFQHHSASNMEVYINLNSVSYKITGYVEKEKMLFDLLKKLETGGIIRNLSNSRGVLRYDYANELYCYCMRKAGNILELKTLFEARRAMVGDEMLFDSCCMSINIDWDGVIHHPNEHVWETRNEIDVMAVRGVTPMFISCKNGAIDENELYKLDSVSRRFGGEYVRKVLLMSNPSHLSDSLWRRAGDMDIAIIPNAAELDADGWSRAFKKAMNMQIKK